MARTRVAPSIEAKAAKATKATKETKRTKTMTDAAAHNKVVADQHKQKQKQFFARQIATIPESARMPATRLRATAVQAGCPRITEDLGQIVNVYAYHTLVAINHLALELANLDKATKVNEHHVIQAMLALEVPVDTLPDEYTPLLRKQDKEDNRVRAYYEMAEEQWRPDEAHKSTRTLYIQHIANAQIARIKGLKLLAAAQEDKTAQDQKGKSRKAARKVQEEEDEDEEEEEIPAAKRPRKVIKKKVNKDDKEKMDKMDKKEKSPVEKLLDEHADSSEDDVSDTESESDSE